MTEGTRFFRRYYTRQPRGGWSMSMKGPILRRPGSFLSGADRDMLFLATYHTLQILRTLEANE